MAVPATALAGRLELSAYAGPVFPTYEQSLEYDPGPLAPPLPGASIEQRGVFRLNARGGLALGGGAAFHPWRALGLEARLDTADVRVRTQGARYRVSARLPAPLGALSTDVDLGSGDVDLQRLKPLSLNLKLRSPGSGVSVSGGLSYLPGFRFVVRQAVGLGPPFGGLRTADVARVSLRAEALPQDKEEGRFGGNACVGVRLQVRPGLFLLVEGRYFRFQRQTLHWGRLESDRALPRIEEAVVRQIAEGLEPVKFNPTFFHVTAGIALGWPR